MKKNLRKNNGFAGIDISISMIIILIFIPTIFGITYNIQKTNADIKKKTTAVEIATNVLEIIKSEQYINITTTGNKLTNDISSKYDKSEYKNSEKEEQGYTYSYYSTIGEKGEHYQIQLGIKNYYPSEDENEDFIKQVKVRVLYSSGNKIQDIDIGMIVQNM